MKNLCLPGFTQVNHIFFKNEDKQILFVGENHNLAVIKENKNACKLWKKHQQLNCKIASIGTFLKDYFEWKQMQLGDQPSEEIYDLFVETQFGNQTDERETHLTSMRRLFDKCLRLDKSKCKYKNILRAHYFDFRNEMEFRDGKKYDGFLNALLDYYKHPLAREYISKLNYTMDDFVYITNFESHPIVMKELSRVHEPYRSRLVQEASEKRNYILEQIRELYSGSNSIESLVKKLDEKSEEEEVDLRQPFYEVGAVLTDLYTVCRMLKPTDPPMRRIIMVAGEAHVDNVLNYLYAARPDEFINFDDLRTTPDHPDKCTEYFFPEILDKNYVN